jgi:hypothetical protein
MIDMSTKIKFKENENNCGVRRKEVRGNSMHDEKS